MNGMCSDTSSFNSKTTAQNEEKSRGKTKSWQEIEATQGRMGLD